MRLGIDSSKGLVLRDLWNGKEWSLEAGAEEHCTVLEPAESKLLLFKQFMRQHRRCL
ncbi:hypothetical protein [Paenibacillus alkaliterrae]|nr:hypothetical protein [Paenibacillus alkaliterrae]